MIKAFRGIDRFRDGTDVRAWLMTILRNARIDRLRARYIAFRKQFPGRKPMDYHGRETWSELPNEFTGYPAR